MPHRNVLLSRAMSRVDLFAKGVAEFFAWNVQESAEFSLGELSKPAKGQ